MTTEAVVSGALHEFAQFLGENHPNAMQRAFWPEYMRDQLQAFAERHGMNFTEIDHEWSKALEVKR